MRKILIIVFIIYGAFIFSQNEENLTKVNYVFDINLRSYTEGIPYKSVLYFADSTSLFIYNSVDLEGEEGFFKKVGDRTGRVNGIHFFRYYDQVGYKFHLNFKTKELTSREVLMGKYEVTVKEKDIDFNWIITEETKKIGDFICNKATTQNFRGRNYEVWFTYDIPVPTGPWKFHGLPGLILEVHDDKDLINITFEKLTKVSSKSLIFKKPIIKTLEKPINFSNTNAQEFYTLDLYLEECFRLYLNYVDRQKDAIIQGLVPSNMGHPSFVNLEYNEEQIKFLNQYLEIEYEDYERSKDTRD